MADQKQQRPLEELTDAELLHEVEKRSNRNRNHIAQGKNIKRQRDLAIIASLDRGLSERKVAAAARAKRGMIWDVKKVMGYGR